VKALFHRRDPYTTMPLPIGRIIDKQGCYKNDKLVKIKLYGKSC